MLTGAASDNNSSIGQATWRCERAQLSRQAIRCPSCAYNLIAGTFIVHRCAAYGSVFAAIWWPSRCKHGKRSSHADPGALWQKSCSQLPAPGLRLLLLSNRWKFQHRHSPTA